MRKSQKKEFQRYSFLSSFQHILSSRTYFKFQQYRVILPSLPRTVLRLSTLTPSRQHTLLRHEHMCVVFTVLRPARNLINLFRYRNYGGEHCRYFWPRPLWRCYCNWRSQKACARHFRQRHLATLLIYTRRMRIRRMSG